MASPSDLKFSPIDERLVGYYLRNRVDTGKDGFITDIKLYEDEPWLLPHVKNDQFKEKRWFYFVIRTRRSGRKPNRTVAGKRGSNGGTWTTTGVKKEIIDSKKKIVIGYKTELAYHKNVKGKPKGDTTGWCMTEYWLAGENDAQFQEVVLCHLRDKNKKVNKVFVDQLPEGKNIVVEQPEQGNRDDDEYMSEINELLGLTHPSIPRLQAQDSRFPWQDMTFAREPEGLGLQNMMGYSDKNTQEQQHPQIYHLPQRQNFESINNLLVITEDECINQDRIFDLADEQAGITQPQNNNKR